MASNWNGYCMMSIHMWCDQAKSVLSQWHSSFSFPHDLTLHKLHFTEKPHQNRTLSSRDMSKHTFWKTIGKKRSCFLWWTIAYIQYCRQRPIQLTWSNHVYIWNCYTMMHHVTQWELPAYCSKGIIHHLLNQSEWVF